MASRSSPRQAIKSPKAATADDCVALEQLPNVGPAMAADLRLLDIHTPQALKGRDGLQLYRALCTATGQRHDPCVLDTLLAVVDFMNGAPPAPWWAYTKQRKALVDGGVGGAWLQPDKGQPAADTPRAGC